MEMDVIRLALLMFIPVSSMKPTDWSSNSNLKGIKPKSSENDGPGPFGPSNPIGTFAEHKLIFLDIMNNTINIPSLDDNFEMPIKNPPVFEYDFEEEEKYNPVIEFLNSMTDFMNNLKETATRTDSEKKEEPE